MTSSAYARVARPLVALPVAFVGVFAAWPALVTLRRGGDVTDALTNGALRSTVWFTTWQAVLSTLITLVIGLPAAWLLSRNEFRGRRALRALTLVPFVLPTLVIGLAFRAVLPGGLRTGVLALVVAHVFLNVAVVVRIVGARWESQPNAFEEAAATLGAPSTTRFATVTWPMIRGSVAAAGGLVFMYCFSTYGAARVLAGPSNPVVETEIYRFAVLAGDMRPAAALAVAQIAVVAIALGLTSRGATVQSTPSRPRLLSDCSPTRRVVVRTGTGLTAIVFLTPLIGLVVRSLRVGDGVSLSAWKRAFDDSTVSMSSVSANLVPAAWATLSTAFVAMMIAVVVGVVIAFVRVTSSSRFVRATATACEIVPVVVSAVVVGLGIILAFRSGFFDWRGSWWLLPVVHAVVALPLVSRSVAAALHQIPDDLRNAAATLGSSPLQIARTIDLGILRRQIGAAAALAALVSVGEFGASSLLTRRGSETLTMAIGRLLGRPGDLVQAQVFVVATVLGVVCLALVTFVDLAAAGGRKP